MTTAHAKAQRQERVRFPDIPERSPDDMTSAKAIHLNGKSHYLGLFFSDRPNTVVDAEHYISHTPTRNMTGVVYPDLLVSFDADPQALEDSNAYVISEQGNPPDFILEIASPRTRRTDRTTKRDIYSGMGVPEYWRFDEKPTRTTPRWRARQKAQREIDKQAQAHIASSQVPPATDDLNLPPRKCKRCSQTAIPGQTRCESCAEKHRISRRKNDTARRARQKAQRQSVGMAGA